jgi:hypothetical protein
MMHDRFVAFQPLAMTALDASIDGLVVLPMFVNYASLCHPSSMVRSPSPRRHTNINPNKNRKPAPTFDSPCDE